MPFLLPALSALASDALLLWLGHDRYGAEERSEREAENECKDKGSIHHLNLGSEDELAKCFEWLVDNIIYRKLRYISLSFHFLCFFFFKKI